MITFAEGPSMDMFPHRKTCEWIEQMPGLSARMCEDGTVMMWRDEDHNVWVPGEQAPKRWQKFLQKRGGLGDAATAGMCPPHPSIKPVSLAKIRRLQNALRGLSQRVQEPALRVVANGLLGTHTVAMTNHAMVRYVGSPPELATGSLSHGQISAFAPQLAAYIEKAPSAPSAPPPPQQQSAPQGAPTMPYNDDPGYYPQQQVAYYPPPPAYGPGYGPHRAPGGLPGDRASLDVKAFVPAQYEHIRVDPTTALLMVCGGLAVVWLITRKKSA